MPDDGNVATTQPEQGIGLKIIEVKNEGGQLIITVEGDSISKLIEGAARRLAYDERLKHGMAQAGIEALGGTYVHEDETAQAAKQDRAIALWRADFRITPMI